MTIRTALRIVTVAACLLLSSVHEANADQQVKLQWDPSPTDVAGYTLHYGTTPSIYTAIIDVGNQTQYEMPRLPEGTYYLAVQAYSTDGAKSPFSNELVLTVTSPAVSPRERSRSDFNADGGADILWRNGTTGALAAWMLSEGFVKIEAGLSHSMPDLNWEVAGTGDFNGDKSPDILWRHKEYGFLVVWFMSGTRVVGSMSPSTSRVADTAWKIAGVGDLSGDGQPDIVWQHDTGPLAWWRMKGMTNVAGSALLGDPSMSYDPKWRVVAVADMNGDDQMDLVWQHAHGWLATWLMFAGNPYGTESLEPSAEFDTSWKVVAAIDANADGKPDLIWQNPATPNLIVWYMDGRTRIGTAEIGGGSIGGADWKVVGPK